MATTKKVSDAAAAPMKKKINERKEANEERIKEKYRRITTSRIKDEMTALSEKRGRPFRNIDLARELGMKDGSLISKWFSNDAEIKDYHLQAMAALFGCTKSWLEGGNARVYESYDSVIEKTGLSETAINRLLDAKEQFDKLENQKIDPKPISIADIISAIIEAPEIESICNGVYELELIKERDAFADNREDFSDQIEYSISRKMIKIIDRFVDQKLLEP